MYFFNRPKTVHLDEGKDEDRMHIPLCHAVSVDHNGLVQGYARTLYTKDETKVTCKRCLKSLEKRKQPA